MGTGQVSWHLSTARRKPDHIWAAGGRDGEMGRDTAHQRGQIRADPTDRPWAAGRGSRQGRGWGHQERAGPSGEAPLG